MKPSKFEKKKPDEKISPSSKKLQKDPISMESLSENSDSELNQISKSKQIFEGKNEKGLQKSYKSYDEFDTEEEKAMKYQKSMKSLEDNDKKYSKIPKDQKSVQIIKENSEIPQGEIDKNVITKIKEEKKLEMKKNIKKNLELNENEAELEKIAQNIIKDSGDKYLKTIVENYGTVEEYANNIIKEMPENMYKITVSDEDQHFMIEEFHNNEKNKLENYQNFIQTKKIHSESHIYNYIDDSIHTLMKNTLYLHENLRIPEIITERSWEVVGNLLNDLQELQEIYKNYKIPIELLQKLNPKDNIKKSIETIIVDYTTNSYKAINKALTSKDPLEWSKMKYYINLLAYNHVNGLVGNYFNSQGSQKLYRNILLKRELLDLYAVGQILFFTNLTSTSTGHIFEKNSTDTY